MESRTGPKPAPSPGATPTERVARLRIGAEELGPMTAPRSGFRRLPQSTTERRWRLTRGDRTRYTNAAEAVPCSQVHADQSPTMSPAACSDAAHPSRERFVWLALNRNRRLSRKRLVSENSGDSSRWQERRCHAIERDGMKGLGLQATFFRFPHRGSARGVGRDRSSAPSRCGRLPEESRFRRPLASASSGASAVVGRELYLASPCRAVFPVQPLRPAPFGQCPATQPLCLATTWLERPAIPDRREANVVARAR